MSSVFIYTGEKGIGKSSFLQGKFLLKPNVGGILQPRINGVKYLLDVVTGQRKKLELEHETSEGKVIVIGNYVFSEAAFRWGKEILSNANSSMNKLIIVDEIGPLEMRGSGLEPVLSGIITNGITLNQKFILVVRPALIESVIAAYHLITPVILQHGDNIPFDFTR